MKILVSLYRRQIRHGVPGHIYHRTVFTCVRLLSREQNLKRLSNFFKNEKEIVSKIRTEFAEPFISIDGLIENVKDNYPHQPSKSILLRGVRDGQLHHPAIPINYIKENVEEIQSNWQNRMPYNERLDILKDVIAPYDRLQIIRQAKNKYVSEKDALTKSTQDFWIHHRENNESSVPPEIEKDRQKSLNLGCIISLLSWIELKLEKLFYENALMIPNITHPMVPVGDESAGEVIKTVNEKKKNKYLTYGHMDAGERTSIIRQKNISNFTGQRTYYLYKEAADLEQALVRYTIDRLKDKGFHMISGSNILHGSAYEGCGITSSKMSELLYHIDSEQEDDFFITGTSEVSIAAFCANHAILHKHLPLKLCCVSTCNRKETRSSIDRRGIYRVHHFTKVEMFAVTANETEKESEELFNEFLQIQEELFTDLELHFRIVNMATEELGLPAHQKVDMEAWMPTKNGYGEISSTSNCTDFQSRRLHILYKNENGNYKFAHTVNGTACAVPRMIIALLENNQSEDKVITLPKVLHPYLQKTTIDRSSRLNMEYIGPNQSKSKWKMPNE
uniref:serine--tRNA ligase, mitochondrial-like n=1 Tax=Styela clava TaxID=7725 RepID=UPI001939A1C0|nr:serine--tRNA ligase, mitochondrial-like [Styela clava]